MIIPVVIFLYYKFKFNSKEDVELLQVSKSLSIKLILKSLLKQIPGFRTSDRVNMIIGSIYYIAWILFVIIGITIGNVKGVYTGVSALFFPYIIFNYLNVISKE
ncbi:putative membrane protein [Clostridium saccharobutylicum]|nr:putative membrane protein [Clostridium saccharobutylicum]